MGIGFGLGQAEPSSRGSEPTLTGAEDWTMRVVVVVVATENS